MIHLLSNLNAVSLQNNNNENGLNNLNKNAVQVNGNNNSNISDNVASFNSANTAAEKSNSKTIANQVAQNNADKGKKEKELSKQIQSDINPTPMLSQAMLFKWDSSIGATVINVVDFKTGKVLAQIPPEQVLNIMLNYQKGSIYNNQV